MENWKDPATPFVWLIAGFLIVTTLLVFIAVFINQYIKNLKQREQEKYELAAAYQRELLETSMEVQERERARIAANLHDDLIAQLYGLKLKNSDTELSGMLTQSIQTARSISHDLCPPMMEHLSMPELVTDIAENYQDHYHIDLRLREEKGVTLDTAKKLQLYRILQEVLTNMHKHAEASQALIFYRLSHKYLSLLVQDNGKGFDLEGGTGMGMKNIALRAAFLKAQYRFTQNGTSGTSFILRTQNQHT